MITSDQSLAILNTAHKWSTSRLFFLNAIDKHLDKYDLIEIQQRSAKQGRRKFVENLLIDRMMALNCQRRKRNLSAA